MAKDLRSGYTTGACAAAGVKAAFLFMAGENRAGAKVTASGGTPLKSTSKSVTENGQGPYAETGQELG